MLRHRGKRTSHGIIQAGISPRGRSPSSWRMRADRGVRLEVRWQSQRLTVDVEREGSHWLQEFSRGKTTMKLKKGKPSRRTGTTIRFWPDPEVFEETTFKREVLAERLQELSFLTRGVEITLVDER